LLGVVEVQTLSWAVEGAGVLKRLSGGLDELAWSTILPSDLELMATLGSKP
jgi:hypothetical protein